MRVFDRKLVALGTEHITQSLLSIVLILLLAKIFGELAARIGQPPVLGELIAGVVIGGSVLGWIKSPDQALQVLAELGSIILLFEIGLDSDLQDFLRVGLSAFLVACIGVIGPFVMGYLVCYFLGCGTTTSIFVGATLTATSVGITARTFTDLHCLHSPEAQIVLGAAVIDDVLGLIILAVVSGLVATGSVSPVGVVKTSVLAILFLVGSIVIGVWVAPYVLGVVKKLRTRGILTTSAIIFCLILALLAHKFQLATIVGAFAAGLVLAKTDERAHIHERIKPIADILVPIFFVILGVRVDVSPLNPSAPGGTKALVFIGLLTLVAATTKVVAGLGVVRRGVNRLAVGVGMMPRGEVGLIFAALGLSRNVLNEMEYTSIIAVVMLTTFITPPMLKIILSRRPKHGTAGPVCPDSSGD